MRMHPRFWRELVARFLYHTKLRTKLSVAYSAFILIPVLFLGLTSYFLSSEHLVNAERAYLEQNMLQLNNTLDYFFEVYMNKSETIFNSTALQREIMTPKRNIAEVAQSHVAIGGIANSLLNDVRRAYSYHSYYFGGNVQLQLYVHNDSLRSDGRTIFPYEGVKDEPWIRRLRDGGGGLFLWQNALVGYDGKRYIGMSRRLLDFATTKEIGVMRLLIPEDRLRDIVGENNPNPLRSVILVNDERATVLSTGVFGLEEHGRIAQAQVGEKLTRLSLGGDEYLIGSARSAMTGWTWFFATPVETVTRKAGSIQKVTAVTMVISLLACVLVGLGISAYFSNRVNLLVRKTDRIAEDGLEALGNPIRLRGNDEIGQLDKNFNRMIERIQLLIDKEYKANLVANQTKLEMLQEQINPHLYYNSLSLIVSLASNRGDEEIADVARHLIKFYKSILNRGEMIASVSAELTMIESYTEIMRKVYRLNIDVEVDIEDGVTEAIGLKLMLQPIVENAILHGLRPAGGGSLFISGCLEGGDVVFQISDDGVGIAEEWLTRWRRGTLADQGGNPLEGKGSGYGIRNIQRRLQLFFGDGYGLSIQSEQRLGTTVTIRFPCLTREEIETLVRRG